MVSFLVTGKIGKLFIMSKGSFRLCSSFSVGAIEIAFLIKLVNRDDLVGEVPVNPCNAKRVHISNMKQLASNVSSLT